jgi:RHS repeat-associated protein
VANYAGGTETTHYVGGILEKLVAGSSTQFKHFIAGPDGLVGVYIRRSSGTLESTFYFTHDHQGNIDSITKPNGSVQVRLSYDAFGKRRKELGWSGPVTSADWTAIAGSIRRGYTEHEHLDNLGLIHMNGRVQDPVIGRFLSADPFVPDPFDGQSFNRYSYVNNNPLTFTDPTGFCSDDVTVDCPLDPNGTVPSIGGVNGGRMIAPNLNGTGAFTYTNAVTAAYLETSGGSPELSATNAEVGRFDQMVQQFRQDLSVQVEGVKLVARLAADFNEQVLTPAAIELVRPDPVDVTIMSSGVMASAADGPLPIGEAYLAGGTLYIAGKRLWKAGKALAEGWRNFRAAVSNAPEGGLVIGKLEDLARTGRWRPGDYTLVLPKLPPGPGRWAQNRTELLKAMSTGRPIRDVSPMKAGGYLDRERNLLIEHGWIFDPQTSLWTPGR